MTGEGGMPGCGPSGAAGGGAMNRTDAEWRESLTPEQYYVCRRGGTEAPFSGRYLYHEETGVYTCAACGNELFRSDDKFDSGTGWPSFREAAGSGAIEAEGGILRSGSEVHCARCGSHLGHLFLDGPGATRQRF